MLGLLLAVAILVPPPHFDHPYRGRLMEFHDSYYNVQQLCKQLNHGVAMQPVWGCSSPGYLEGTKTPVCVIVLTKLEGRDFVILRRHEIAHCNGWNHEHSN